METPNALGRTRQAFTLMELLTVIAIIAILIGLLLPVISIVKETARKTQAKNDVTQLVSAVNAYNTEYGSYPLNNTQSSAGAAGWDTVYGDPDGLYSSADLCNILRAIADSKFNTNNQLNPRGVIFLQPNMARDATSPRSGIVPLTVTGPAGNTIKAGSYVDPWGNEYVTFLDANYDHNLTTALGWFYYTNTPTVNAGAAACSLGKDHAWGTAKRSGQGGDGKFDGSD